MRFPGSTITAPVVLALLAIVGVAVAILWGADSTVVGEAFISTPEFLFWLLVLAAQAAVWAVAALPVGVTAWRRGGELHSAGLLTKPSVASLGAATLLLIGTAVAFTIASNRTVGGTRRDLPVDDAWPLPDHALRVGPLVFVALLVGVLAVFGMWLAGIELERMSRAPVQNVARFVALRSEINTLLAIAGVIIGLGTLSSGLLREAVLATNEVVLEKEPPPDTQPFVPADDPETPEIEPGYRTTLAFDAQYVALYGLFFTVLLAVAFAPTFLTLRRAGRVLRDSTFVLPAPTDDNFDDVVEQRKEFDAYLQTNLSALASFKAGIAILSPFAASLAALVIELPT